MDPLNFVVVDNYCLGMCFTPLLCNVTWAANLPYEFPSKNQVDGLPLVAIPVRIVVAQRRIHDSVGADHL